jgi:LacI family transcriptional regulator
MAVIFYSQTIRMMCFDVFNLRDSMPTFLDQNRPTLVDVAAYAGVSSATADRVLNRRPGVRSITQQRVLNAAVKLGYLDSAEIKRFNAPPLRKLTFLLPKGNNVFMQMLGDTIGFSKDYFTSNHISPVIAYIEQIDPPSFVQALTSLAKTTHGIVMMAPNHPLILAAIDQLAKKKICVITIISDIQDAKRIAYIGLDNFRTGRTAALLLDKFSATPIRKVAVINGWTEFSGHQLRKEGMTAYFADKDPSIKVIASFDSHDEPKTIRQLTLKLLKNHPDVNAIYNTGGASEGIGQALNELGLQHNIVFIGHGLTPHTRLMLSDGTMDAVITQSPTATILNCIRLFSEYSTHKEVSHTTTNIRSEIIFKENLP